jgi:uncharacterized DUF497 family protein
MEFEYDPWKSLVNADKHGIDFEQARALWDDDRLLILAGKSDHEPRLVATGRIGNRHWTAVYTIRGSVTRLISVRRARREEIDRYEIKEWLD